MTEYNFRTLNAKDIFPVCNIISKIGFEKLKESIKGQDLTGFTELDDKVFEAIGVNVFFDIVGVVISNIDKCEDEIFAFFASITDLSKKAIQEMPLGDFAEMISEFVQKEELKDFMKVVSRFLK